MFISWIESNTPIYRSVLESLQRGAGSRPHESLRFFRDLRYVPLDSDEVCSSTVRLFNCACPTRQSLAGSSETRHDGVSCRRQRVAATCRRLTYLMALKGHNWRRWLLSCTVQRGSPRSWCTLDYCDRVQSLHALLYLGQSAASSADCRRSRAAKCCSSQESVASRLRDLQVNDVWVWPSAAGVVVAWRHSLP